MTKGGGDADRGFRFSSLPLDRMGRFDEIRLSPWPRRDCRLRQRVRHPVGPFGQSPPRFHRPKISCCGLQTPSWVAIDRSHDGIFVDGVRVSTVDVRDGLTITIGDPRQGPRLAFQIGVPAETPAVPPRDSPSEPVPPSAGPHGPNLSGPRHPVPTEQTTQRMRLPHVQPVTEFPTGPLNLPPNEPPALPIRATRETFRTAAHRTGFDYSSAAGVRCTHAGCGGIPTRAHPQATPRDTRCSAMCR